MELSIKDPTNYLEVNLDSKLMWKLHDAEYHMIPIFRSLALVLHSGKWGEPLPKRSLITYYWSDNSGSLNCANTHAKDHSNDDT